MSSCDLTNKTCKPCEGGIPALTLEESQKMLSELNNWQLIDNHKKIQKIFHFKNYYQTMAFVNAIAWVAHQEDHHPDLLVSYNQCQVNYTTHAIDGLSENDFICAAKIDTLKV